MYNLICISKAKEPMSNADVSDMFLNIKTCQKLNNVTGLLAYIEGGASNSTKALFMQLIEGPKQEVECAFEKFKTDPRHHQVVILNQDHCDDRHFENWKMVSERINLDENPDLQLFFELDDNVLSSPAFKKTDIILKFLRAF